MTSCGQIDGLKQPLRANGHERRGNAGCNRNLLHTIRTQHFLLNCLVEDGPGSLFPFEQ